MADGTDAADARHDRRHLVDRTTLGDPLEAPELGHVELGVDHLARVVEVNGDLGVAFDPGDRVDDDRLCHGWPQRPKRAWSVSGVRPSSRSMSAW